MGQRRGVPHEEWGAHEAATRPISHVWVPRTGHEKPSPPTSCLADLWLPGTTPQHYVRRHCPQKGSLIKSRPSKVDK